jgi:amidase
MAAHKLDAVLFLGGSGASIAAAAGYPTVIVPFTRMASSERGQPFPAGFTPQPSPLGLSFTGMACQEGRLLGLGYAFEQATKRRVPPPL